MKTGQGFLLVFSITSQSSLSELSELREQIIRIKDDENVPIVIVGNKSDLESERLVTRARAFSVSQSWGNAPYYETSARRRGVFLFPDLLGICHYLAFSSFPLYFPQSPVWPSTRPSFSPSFFPKMKNPPPPSLTSFTPLIYTH